MSMSATTELETTPEQATTWDMDPAHSTAEFSVKHLMISTVTGRFKALKGTIQFQDSEPVKSMVEAEIEVASIDTGVEMRDNHLRSADFFDAANHPKIRFKSRRIEPLDQDSGRVHGELTIRGTTRTVVLDVERLGTITDPWGNLRTGLTATTTIDRKDFGLNWNQALETGGVLVGDKVKIALHMEAVRRK
jgi:polyisoprenoid-binding protein YceI